MDEQSAKNNESNYTNDTDKKRVTKVATLTL